MGDDEIKRDFVEMRLVYRQLFAVFNDAFAGDEDEKRAESLSLDDTVTALRAVANAFEEIKGNAPYTERLRPEIEEGSGCPVLVYHADVYTLTDLTELNMVLDYFHNDLPEEHIPDEIYVACPGYANLLKQTLEKHYNLTLSGEHVIPYEASETLKPEESSLETADSSLEQVADGVEVLPEEPLALPGEEAGPIYDAEKEVAANEEGRNILEETGSEGDLLPD